MAWNPGFGSCFGIKGNLSLKKKIKMALCDLVGVAQELTAWIPFFLFMYQTADVNTFCLGLLLSFPL